MTIACTVSFTSKHVKAFYDGFLVFIGNDKVPFKSAKNVYNLCCLIDIYIHHG